jgi:serine protease Do
MPAMTMPIRSHTRRVARVVAVFVVVVLPWRAAAQTPARVAAAAGNADLSAVIEATTRAVTPGVVEIFTTSFTPAEGFVPRSADLVSTERASGSGVIVDSDGHIVTNAHVVRGAQRLRVELGAPASGRSLLATRSRSVAARVLGIDAETDLAVLKIEANNLPVLTFSDSDELKAGQLVLAFGSPLGLHNSVSLGVVSGVARQLEPESPMVYVQTDASINRGSSGGPLVDLRGRVVGINTLILSQRGGHEGLGFAAPSNIVRTVYEQIRKSGHVRRGDIGIRAQTVTPALAAGLGLARDHGVVLADVIPGSPADRAGLRPGDVVVALDGKPMENGRQLRVNLYRHFAGEFVSLEVLRDTATLKVLVAIAERRDPFAGLTVASDPRQNLVPRLGILAVSLNRQIAERLPVLRVTSGVVVVSTVAGALDARDGWLAAGDVISTVNRTPIQDLAGLRAVLEQLKPGDPVVLQLERRGELMYLAFTVE